MDEPTKKSVKAAFSACDQAGEEMFVKRVAAGNGRKSHIVLKDGKAYPLKAIWADAHEPAISPAKFHTKDAIVGLQSFGFECFKLLPEL